MKKLLVLLCALVATLSSALAQTGTVQFSQPVFTVSESIPVAYTDPNGKSFINPTVMTVTRTGGSTGVLSVDFCVWADETTNNAKEYRWPDISGGNFAPVNGQQGWVSAGTLTWANGDSSPKTIPFSILIFNETRYPLATASAVQGTITYSARLVSPSVGGTLGANSTAKLEITDAQAPAAGVLNLTSRRFYGADGGSALISVRRDGGTTGSVSVNYTTSSTLPAVGQFQASIGAGVAGTHYTTTSGTLTWAAGDAAVKTFSVPLPATGSANGALNVAINLSAPTNSAVLGAVPSALLTIQNTGSTVYDINDNLEPSTYRVSLPPGPGPIRGILFWWPGTNGDDRHFTTDPNFRKIADQWRFAVVSPRSNYDGSPHNVAFPQPSLSFFFDRLSQIAKTTGRAEILNAPFVLSGMSAGSYSSSDSLGIWPERTIAILAQQGWSGPPLNMFGVIEPTYVFNAAMGAIPALNLGGQNEGTQSPPSEIFPEMNEHRKLGLTRSAVAMCWGRGHTFGNTGATYNSVALYWLDQVMAAGRYPANLAPTTSTSPTLGVLPLSSGWWGSRNCTNTRGTSNLYELPGGSSRFLNIGPDATFTGIKDVNNALVDSWLPTESAARAYRAFVSLPTIQFSAPAQFTSGLTGQPVTLSIAENGFGSGLTRIEFFDGNTKIGEDTTSPYTLSWSPTLAGARSITAVASNLGGPIYTAFTLFLASDPVAATITAGQSFNGVVNLPFAYQLVAGGPPTSYALDSGSLPPGVTLNTATGLLSGTPTTAGTYTPAFTATNSGGTSASVTATFTITATAGLIVSEPFAYTVPSNNPDPDAGLNGGNGLPPVNVGGSPSGTGNGMRGNWGTTTDVVAGLAYTQGTKTLTTSAGAGRINNATWGGNPYFYQNMATDPFIAQRIGGSNNGNFGTDGSSIYVSFLAQTSSSTNEAFAFSLRYDGSQNFFISNTTTGWSLNGTTATGAVLALNTPTLMVVRFDFAAGSTDTVRLWVNPPLGVALGAPNATVSGISFPGISNVQTRSAVANAMTVDELRVGTSLAAVTPFTDSATAPVIALSQSSSTAVGSDFSYQIVATSSPTSYALTSGTLPPGVTLNTTTGVLSGIPNLAGNYTPSFTATNAIGTSVPAGVTITVAAMPPAIVYEPFNYTAGVGALASQNGGTGWTSGWNSATNDINAPGFTYNSGSDTLVTSGGRMTIKAGQGSFRNLPTAYTSGTYWFSFLARSSTPGNGQWGGLSLFNGGSEPLFFGQPSGSLNWGIDNGTTPATNSTANQAFIVVKVVLNSVGTDSAFLWVNPALNATPLEVNAASSRSGSEMSFDRIRIQGSIPVDFDEIRMGTSYSQVAPIAVPTSALASFRTTNGLATNGSEDLLTPAGDGVQNLLKYAFNMLGNGGGQGSNLNAANSSVITANGSAGLPLVDMDGTGRLRVTFIRRKSTSNSGISYAVEFSDTLANGTWAVNASATTNVTSIDDTFERVVVTDNLTSAAKRFVRVRVTSS